jgi:hypothetical protein
MLRVEPSDRWLSGRAAADIGIRAHLYASDEVLQRYQTLTDKWIRKDPLDPRETLSLPSPEVATAIVGLTRAVREEIAGEEGRKTWVRVDNRRTP